MARTVRDPDTDSQIALGIVRKTRVCVERGGADILANPPAISEYSEKGLVLSLDAFVRSVGVQRPPFAFFLGAGASTTSGIPSAEMCIWEWKREIFLTNNPGLEDQFSELSLEGVRRKIQHWLDRQGGYPKERASEEYGFYIKATRRNRRIGLRAVVWERFRRRLTLCIVG